MDLRAELTRLNTAPELPEWVVGTMQELLDQAQADAANTLRLRDEQITRRDTELHSAQTKIQALILELAHLRRMRFGASSEALSAETRDLFQETLASDVAAAEIELAKQAEASAATDQSAPRSPRARAGRQPLPDHLPRIEHRHEPETCTCGQCGKDLVLIGEDISEQLDVEPARFFVHRHIRPQYACRSCETVSAAPIPPAVIDGGMAAAGLLAWVVIGKYLDHLPLVPAGTDRGTGPGHAVPLDDGGMGGAHRRVPATTGGAPGRVTAGTQRAACRRDAGGATGPRQRQDKAGVSVGVPQQCAGDGTADRGV